MKLFLTVWFNLLVLGALLGAALGFLYGLGWCFFVPGGSEIAGITSFFGMVFGLGLGVIDGTALVCTFLIARRGDGEPIWMRCPALVWLGFNIAVPLAAVVFVVLQSGPIRGNVANASPARLLYGLLPFVAAAGLPT